MRRLRNLAAISLAACRACRCLPRRSRRPIRSRRKRQLGCRRRSSRFTPRGRWSWRPTRSPRKPASTCCAPAASAADAVVAVQTVLGLVEPQSSGLGGGAFLDLVRRQDRHGDHFRRPRDGACRCDAGTVPRRGRQAARLLRRGGRRPIGRRSRRAAAARNHPREIRQAAWAELLQPAIELAEAGFAVSPRLHTMIADDVGRLDTQPATRAYFFDALGAPLRDRRDAAAIRTMPRACGLIADGRRRRLLQGIRSPAKIVAAVSGHPTNPGSLTPRPTSRPTR